MGDGIMFFRCLLCGSVVSAWDIREHAGCRKCGGARIRPTNLTVWEKIVQIVRHPRVWKWKELGL